MSNHSFESFLMQTLKAREWDLRKFLSRKLSQAGFIIQEDDYLSRRVAHETKYNKVHNLLAIRGNPRVCLVAHTDVCRDHKRGRPAPDVFPTIKEHQGVRIIQDKDCQFQVGGDDRLGVAINTWIALNTGYDMAVLFTTDEEVGLVSADYVKFKELKTYDLLVEVDRGNHSNQLVTEIGGIKLCGRKTTKRLLQIAREENMPREEVTGMATDVASIISNGIAKEAVNMTCGYHGSYGDGPREYIDIEEARDTMKYVSAIIKYYDLRRDEDEENSSIEIYSKSEHEEEEDQDNIARDYFQAIADELISGDLEELMEHMSIEDYAHLSRSTHPKTHSVLHKSKQLRGSKKSRRRYIADLERLFDEVDHPEPEVSRDIHSVE